MNEQIGAVIEGPAQIGRRERGVDEERQSLVVGDPGDRVDVQDVESWIAEDLAEARKMLNEVLTEADSTAGGEDGSSPRPAPTTASPSSPVARTVPRTRLRLGCCSAATASSRRSPAAR